MRRVVVLAFALGCAALPVRSATGHRVKRIMIAESLALRAHQPAQIELSGTELEPAVALLDKNGVLRLRQPSFSSAASDGSSLFLVIETTNDSYSIVLANCPEPHVCGFMRDGLITRLPETCATDGPTCLGTCTLSCDVAPF